MSILELLGSFLAGIIFAATVTFVGLMSLASILN